MARYQITNQPAEIEWELRGDSTRRIMQNVHNLMMCRMGEVPFDRLRGFDPSLYDLPLGKLEEKLLPELDRTLLWEPRAETVSASCALDEHGQTVITVLVDIETDEQGG